MTERRPQVQEKSQWAYGDEHLLYNQCLADALEETERTIAVSDDNDKPIHLGVWAAGNIRIGELVLIIDSDTRVPEDCFLDAASEMHASPECSIIQHASDVVRRSFISHLHAGLKTISLQMFVANHFFENGIAFFTRLVNTSISSVVVFSGLYMLADFFAVNSWVCSNGDVGE